MDASPSMSNQLVNGQTFRSSFLARGAPDTTSDVGNPYFAAENTFYGLHVSVSYAIL
jgi:hypothetical protein